MSIPRPLAGFLLRFVAGWIVVMVLIARVPALDRFAVRHTVASLGGVARLFGVPFQDSGSTIVLGRAGLAIVPDCTPLMPLATLAIAVLAFPAPWRWRLAGLTGGAVVLWLYNLFRIFAMVPVLMYRPGWFDFVHIYLWQTVTLALVFALFLLWLRLQRGPATLEPEPAPGRPGAAPAP